MKQSSKKFSLRLKNLTTKQKTLILLSVPLVILGVWFIPKYLERQKFMTLKQDMLALQTEFNKIDPGWEYNEGCYAKKEKFKEDQPSYCYLSIELDVPPKNNFEDYRKNALLLSKFHIMRESTFEDQGRTLKDVNMNYLPASINCGLGGKSTEQSMQNLTLQCTADASDFYFPKTQ